MDLQELDQLLVVLGKHGVKRYVVSEGEHSTVIEFPGTMVLADTGGKAEPEDEQDDDSPPTNMSELRKWGLPKPVDPTVTKPEVKKAGG